MPALTHYTHYRGYHPVTGSIANALAYAGVTAPHTGGPYTEDLLAGIAGGVMVGYFYFDYEGHDPQVNIVTRNSFHEYGFEAIASRLGLVREHYQTTSEAKARENLRTVIESGDVPIVTADVYSLGYEHSEFGDSMWSMQPLVVSAYEPDGTATIADRARVPLIVPAVRLDAARARVKKERFRITTIDFAPGDDGALASAVETGIRECLDLSSEKPPAGSANNFGFRALERWIASLRKPAGKTSWHTLFPEGRRLVSSLSTAYTYSALFWKDESESADRSLYARFLKEAAAILDKPSLMVAVDAYEDAARAWKALAHALLPDEVALLAEERRLLHERHSLFLDRGTESDERRDQIDRERAELRNRSTEIGRDERERTHIFDSIADTVEAVLASERRAYDELRRAIDAG
jgi:hypothetical protein